MLTASPLSAADSGERTSSFADLGLPAPLVTTLRRQGMATPFPIQTAAIPDALAGRDVLGRGATGSGKTLAFGLPMLARLAGGRTSPRRPRGLVLVPTRELALQVTDALSALADSLGLRVRPVVGGMPMGRQVENLRRGVDLLVATPGRLDDHLRQGTCDLSEVEVTTLDEADQMADMGFLPVVRALLDRTRPGGQRLLFSATLDGDVDLLVRRYLSAPATHSLAPAAATIETMDHHFVTVPHDDRVPVTAAIAGRGRRVILFVRTKHGADRLVTQLERAGVSSKALHGGKTQGQRTRALGAFKDGQLRVLVATDVAARGIHVDHVDLVLHVDPPVDPKSYLHRAGRTARAGESGVVVTLVAPYNLRAAKKLAKDAGIAPTWGSANAAGPLPRRIENAVAPAPEPVPVVDRHERRAPDVATRPRDTGRDTARDPDRRHRPRSPQPRRDARPGHPDRRSGHATRPSGSRRRG